MPPKAPPDDALATYRAKRSAENTPEPFGRGADSRSQLFVVQKHDATRLHYDFRLEWGGVLLSWAVPKGPSLDPKEQRLAVRTEDHPIEYADFEGIIPEGNYGAGPSLVWDRGLWIPHEDPDRGLEKGHLGFELQGLKLKGSWMLVRTHAKKGNEKEWLLIKKGDAHARSGGEPFSDTSILSGLSIEELREGTRRAEQVRERLVELRAPRRHVALEQVQPMLSEWRERPFTDAGWVFELKYDGFRLLAGRDEGHPRLIYRRGLDATHSFPDVVTALHALPYSHVIFDGEVAVLDPQGRPSFQRLQKRTQLQRAVDIKRAAVALPAQLFLFDLLAFEDFDLRPLPLVERKALLARLLPAVGVLRYAEHFPEQGERLYAEAVKLGFEGIVGKRADSPYRAGRHPDWVKVRHERTGDFVVVGFTDPQGTRSGFGALLLAAYSGQRLLFTGRVGTGFSEAQLAEVNVALRKKERRTPPCEGPLPKGKGYHWVTPERVCEVRFTEWTQEGLFRAPVFLRFRDDKRLEECVLERPAVASTPEQDPPERKVALSNLDKPFWPKEGLTKGDLISYYREIAPWLLPYLRDRPVVMTRFPDGIDGKSFFQKDAPAFAPEWLRVERLWSDDTQRQVGYIICDDVESLLYVANSASIPIHVWASRVTDLQRPDWCILDLDPKGAPFANVVKLARAIHELCEELELPCYPKTSGSTGLHVLIPLGRQCTFAEAKSLGELLARLIATRHPDIATVVRDVGARGGRVYIDYLQNGHGKLLVSPFSVRPLPGGPISMPLRWSDVNGRLTATSFRMENAIPRLRRLKVDPMLAVLSERPDLAGALRRLSDRLRSQ